MSESPHELLESGYAAFHSQDYASARSVWQRVVDHPDATSDDVAAARECLELLAAEDGGGSGSNGGAVNDVVVESTDDVVFDSPTGAPRPHQPFDPTEATSDSVPLSKAHLGWSQAPATAGFSTFDGAGVVAPRGDVFGEEPGDEGFGDIGDSGFGSDDSGSASASASATASVSDAFTQDAFGGDAFTGNHFGDDPGFGDTVSDGSGRDNGADVPDPLPIDNQPSEETSITLREQDDPSAPPAPDPPADTGGDADVRVRELEAQVAQLQEAALENERAMNKLNHELESRQVELNGANKELADLSRELLTKDREVARLRAGLGQADDAADTDDAASVPSADASDDQLANPVILRSERPAAPTPALFQFLQSPGRSDPGARRDIPDRQAHAAPTRRIDHPGAQQPPRTNRMRLTTSMTIDGERERRARSASRSWYSIQAVGAGALVRTGLHRDSRPFNWIAALGCIGLLVAWFLPWRIGPMDVPMQAGGLGLLLNDAQTMWLTPEAWQICVELLGILPVIAVALLIWELVHWSQGVDGHLLLIFTGLLSVIYTLGVFALIGPGHTDTLTIPANLQWHLPFALPGFWTALGGSALLVIGGLFWPRSRGRRSAEHVGPPPGDPAWASRPASAPAAALPGMAASASPHE